MSAFNQRKLEQSIHNDRLLYKQLLFLDTRLQAAEKTLMGMSFLDRLACLFFGFKHAKPIFDDLQMKLIKEHDIQMAGIRKAQEKPSAKLTVVGSGGAKLL